MRRFSSLMKKPRDNWNRPILRLEDSYNPRLRPQISTPTITLTSYESCLPFQVSRGLDDFLSPKSTQLLVNSYKTHLKTASLLITGTEHILSLNDLFKIIEKTENESNDNPRLLHHVSQAWNLDFFLKGLINDAKVRDRPPDFLFKAIEESFTSWTNFKRLFEVHVEAMIGCGWVWLVNTPSGDLKILNTFNGASPLFKTFSSITTKTPTPTQTSQFNLSSPVRSKVQNSPIIGINLWESAFTVDYGMDRKLYVTNWWKAVNWDRAGVLLLSKTKT